MRDFSECRRLDAEAACFATCENDNIDFLAAFCISVISDTSIPGRGVDSCSANVVSYSSSVNLFSPPSILVIIVVDISVRSFVRSLFA